MKNSRKHYTPEEKVAILRRHLLEKEPISKLCDELGLHPRSSTGGKRSSSRTERPPSSRRRGQTTQPTRSESLTWRRRSRPRTRFWPN
jgi:transposase-like protein